MRELRREIKASVASAISDLRNMQKLQDVLEQAQVAILFSALLPLGPRNDVNNACCCTSGSFAV